MVAAKMAGLENGKRPSPIGGGGIPTRNETAKMLNVGHGSIDRAKQVIKNAVPELRDMVDQGEVSVNAASQVSKLPEPEQRKAISGGVAGAF